MITILLADDTDIAREGLRTILSGAEDMQVIGEAATTLEAVRMVHEHSPDIVLMDLKWFGNENAGQTAIRRIKASVPTTRIIALTAFEGLINDAIRSGADSAVSKTVEKGVLLDIIRELYVQEFDNIAVGSPELLPLMNLSDREFQVLKLIMKGYSNAEIGAALEIEVSTVKNHVRSILMKLNAKNRTEAADIGRNLGL